MAAASGDNFIISCPTGLDIPIAIKPLNVPITKHNHKPQKVVVFNIVEGLYDWTSFVLLDSVLIYPSSFDGNLRGIDNKTITKRILSLKS